MNQIAPVGVVLTGGRSSRMGTDKALLEVGGVPMAARVAAALGPHCSGVVAVGGDTAALTALGMSVVADRRPGEGPLGGILTALEELETDVLVAPCDMAALDSATVGQVVHAARIAVGCEVVIASSPRGLEPLLGYYRRAATPTLRRVFDSGERAPRRALRVMHWATVSPADDAPLTNVNDPEGHARVSATLSPTLRSTEDRSTDDGRTAASDGA